MTNNNIMVSVSMITYKHEPYIREAIEGVLMQQVDFPVELIIADDCSPDNTSSIVQEIIENHPNGHWIKYFKHEKNIGMQANGLFASEKCTGKYIAICEGDDFWIDRNKLKIQINILESDNNLVGCFHNTEERNYNVPYTSNLYVNSKFKLRNIVIDDLLLHNIIPTSALVLRRKFLPAEYFTKNFQRLNFGDWAINLLLARHGNFYYYPFIMSVRRMHQNSIWGMQDQNENIRKTIDSLKLMISYNWFETSVNDKLESTIQLLKNNDKSKEKINYLINKLINFLIKLKNKS